MKKTVFIIFIFFTIVIYAQNKNVEQQYKKLKAELSSVKNTRTKLHILDSLTGLVWRKQGFPFDSLAKETINLAIKLDTTDLAAYHVVNRMYYFGGPKGDLITAEKIFLYFKNKHLSQVKTPNRLNNFYKAGGSLYYVMNKYNTSLDNYNKALKHALKTTNYQAIGEIYMGKGMNYYNLGNLIKSTKNLQKSIPYFKKTNSTNEIVNVKNVMVSLYSENGFYDEAKKERDEAIKIAKKGKHYLYLSQLYFNYSVELKKTGTIQERIKYIKKAIEEVKKSKYKKYYLPIYYAEMVNAQSEANNLTKATEYLNLLEKEERKNAPGETTSFYKEAKMRYAFAQKKYKKALLLAQDYLKYKKKIKQFDGIEEANLFLYKAYKKLGDYKKANEYLLNYQKSNDSIVGLKKAKILSYYQTLYETEKRDIKIQKQKSKIEILNIKNKIKTQWLIFGGIGLVSIFLFFVVIRSRNFAKREQKAQKEFSTRLLQEQEKERKRISKELHDGVGQNLLLIKNSLRLNPKKTPKLIDNTIEEVRSISRNLHPVQLEKFGLTKAIKNIVDDINELTDIFVSEEIDNIDNFFPKGKEIYLYRIIQECFNNIIKHSGATAAKITIKKEADKVTVIIQDNGKGFAFEQDNNKQKSFGLKSLQERIAFLKGKIKFDAEKDKGTIITITSFK